MKEEFISETIFRMNENLERVEKCISMLTEEQIWLKPNDKTNSIGTLTLHLQGNITQYIISSIGHEPDTRIRNEEFESRIDTLLMIENFKSTIKKATDTIQQITSEELLKKRRVQGFDLSGIGIIIHVVEHLSYHVGQISTQTKLLTDKDLGYYNDINLNITSK
ncbi:MAG: DinB family protein [Salibacteraceae bacterium]